MSEEDKIVLMKRIDNDISDTVIVITADDEQYTYEGYDDAYYRESDEMFVIVWNDRTSMAMYPRDWVKTFVIQSKGGFGGN